MPVKTGRKVVQMVPMKAVEGMARTKPSTAPGVQTAACSRPLSPIAAGAESATPVGLEAPLGILLRAMADMMQKN